MSTYAGFLKLVSCADVLDGISLRMCRQCTAVSHHARMHISIHNLSNAPLYTYELCFNYIDSMLLMQFPSASHWQHLLPSTDERAGTAPVHSAFFYTMHAFVRASICNYINVLSDEALHIVCTGDKMKSLNDCPMSGVLEGAGFR